jgi:hypothetical protein
LAISTFFWIAQISPPVTPSQAANEPINWWLAVIALGCIGVAGYLLRRSLSQADKLQDQINEIRDEEDRAIVTKLEAISLALRDIDHDLGRVIDNGKETIAILRSHDKRSAQTRPGEI